MRITRTTDDELILDYVPWGLGAIIAVVGLGLVGWGLALIGRGEWVGGLALTLIAFAVMAGCFAAFMERCQLWLSRAAGTAVYRRRTLRGRDERTVALADLQRARCETQTRRTRRKGSARNRTRTTVTRRAVLDLAGGEVLPLTQTSMTGPGPEAAAAAVNRWLDLNRQPA
jgi:hypothetical protein